MGGSNDVPQDDVSELGQKDRMEGGATSVNNNKSNQQIAKIKHFTLVVFFSIRPVSARDSPLRPRTARPPMPMQQSRFLGRSAAPPRRCGSAPAIRPEKSGEMG